MSKGKDDAPHELESQFVLRLPPVRAVRSGAAVAVTCGSFAFTGAAGWRHGLARQVEPVVSPRTWHGT